MGFINWVGERIENGVSLAFGGLLRNNGDSEIITARNYRLGKQPHQLKVKPGQHDDNITINFTGLVANRIVSQMVGKGIDFDFGGDDKVETEQEKWVKACLDANKQEELFHRAALQAIESGDGYFDISGGKVYDLRDKEYPRIILQKPEHVTIETLPEDFEIVVKYIIQYTFIDFDGKEKARKREIVKLVDADGWEINDYIADNSGRWQPTGTIPWPYKFAPIIHWKNLPSVDSINGEPDISKNLRDIQDYINFSNSNIAKIIRLQAHLMRIGKGLKADDLKTFESGADKMLLIPETSDVIQLDQLGDLTGAMAFIKTLRQAMFDCARVVDIDSLGDKLGALTNFALRVLYQDNLSMIDTHRELFGDAIEELVIRLQQISEMEPIEATVVWPDFLPENDAEISAAYQSDLNMGVVSKETISGLRGYNWEQEQERIANDAAQTDNIGAAILRNFEQGGATFG